MPGLAISDVAERTGIAPGTLRMWEQRYGFPEPDRTATGHRRYPEGVVDVLRQVMALRDEGLSVGAAIERARRRDVGEPDRPSIYAAVASAPRVTQTQMLRKSTLVAMSRAIEDQAMSCASAPVAFAAFQHEPFYRAVQQRYAEMARLADGVAVFADFDEVGEHDGIVELPIGSEDALGNEWAVVVDAPGYAACLLAWEPARGNERGGSDDGDRRFEALWSIDPETTRRAAVTAAKLASRVAPAVGERFEELLADRPLAMERPAPALTALTNRMVAYLDEGGDASG